MSYVASNDEFYMQLALNEAWKYQGLTYPNPAVGAVVLHNGAIVAIEAHKKAGTSHAEVLALIQAYETISNEKVNFDINDSALSHNFLLSLDKDFFSNCTIYVTLEPCSHVGKTPSCASLLKELNLSRVVVGTKDPIDTHSGGAALLSNVTFSVLEKECKDLLEPFVIWQTRSFVMFKLAQNMNGNIGGGYLSSKESLVHVHKLRESCSKLLIGGNTVREDRPTLDCRFIEVRAPDVVIYSKSDTFDENIPLFNVENREVEVSNNLDFLEEPSFVLVEGGEGMLNALKSKIDWVLTYVTPSISKKDFMYSADVNIEFLHQDKNQKDLIIWSRRVD